MLVDRKGTTDLAINQRAINSEPEPRRDRAESLDLGVQRTGLITYCIIDVADTAAALQARPTRLSLDAEYESPGLVVTAYLATSQAAIHIVIRQFETVVIGK